MNGIDLKENFSYMDFRTFMIEINHKRIDLWIGRLFGMGGFLAWRDEQRLSDPVG
jgi:hypothetical protein